jgi:glycosyltransferase involved in cell wall biosynthesis
MEKYISVVIPTYRRPELLQKCMDALIAQEFPAEHFEIIVVSDGPDAKTESFIRRIASKEDPRIRFYSLPEKKGPAAARNMGWKNASGSLIAFTDDDCLPDKRWLSATWNAYKNEDEIVYSGKLVVPVSEQPTDHEKNTAHLQTAEFITANCFCTKKALEKTSGFDERFRLAWREDSDLQFSCMQKGIPIEKLQDAIVVHPVRKAPWGNSIKEQRKGMFNALLYKKYPRWYRDRIQSQPAWNYYLMIISLVISFAALIVKSPIVAIAFAVLWFLLTLKFILKRLRGTSRAISHVTEMIVTSVCIPFLSVYWQLYGSFRYRVFLL